MKEPRSLTMYMKSLDDAKPMSAEQERRELLAYKAGDKRAGDRVIESNRRFVVGAAKKYGRYGRNLEDLIQEGNVGMLIALTKFDPEYGTRFLTYAKSWVHLRIQECLKRTRRIAKIPDSNVADSAAAAMRCGEDIGAAMGDGVSEQRREATVAILTGHDVNIDDANALLYSHDAHYAEPIPDAVDASIARQRVRAAMRCLPDRTLGIIYRRYWHEETLEEIGKDLGVTRERVRQIEADAINKLRREMRRYERDYKEAA